MLRPRIAVLVAFILALMSLAPAAGAQEFSHAEKLLFMSDHLKNIDKPTTLSYRFKKTGSLEQGYDDKAIVRVQSVDGADAKVVRVDYLSGANKLDLPEVTKAEGNPVLLSFLEKDTREMKRLTGGSVAYFRKRIRLALVDKATLRPVQIDYQGKKLAATEVRIAPFADDPNKARLKGFVHKTYLFTLSDKIPGNLYQLRSIVADPTNKDKTLIDETLTFDGATK